MKIHSAVLIPGDGIGPEITVAVRRILDAAGAPIEWVERKAGVAALEDGPDVLPESTTEAIEHHGIALKGPCTTPVGEGFTSVNVQLRQRLNLYAAVRTEQRDAPYMAAFVTLAKRMCFKTLVGIVPADADVAAAS